MKPPHKAPKLVVLIPTRDRPKILNLTVDSVLEQAARHGHKVQVVISDTSDKPNAAKNEALLSRLQARYPNQSIHYYPPEPFTPKVLEPILRKATMQDRIAFFTLVANDGHYGAHRNRLAILGALHGGRNAAYLHLDDDTPLLGLDQRESRKGSVVRHNVDILGRFLTGWQAAVRRGRPGFRTGLAGVRDAAVSRFSTLDMKPEPLKEWLKNPTNIFPSVGFGPARILEFKAMTMPYVPYGKDEDLNHTDELYRWYGLRLEKRDPYLRDQPREPYVLHLGVTGHRPKLEGHFHQQRELEREIGIGIHPRKPPTGLAAHWNRLMERAAAQKRRG